MHSLSKKYSLCFDYLDALKKKRMYINIATPLDLPSLVARNHLMKEYYSLRLSKMCVIVNAVSHVECCPAPLPTIYLFGPDLLGEKEAVLKSGYFMVFPHDWRNTNGYGWSGEHLGLNTARKLDLIKRYDQYDWLREATTMVDQLTTEEIIRLAYDFTFERSKPSGLRRTVGFEAFSKTSISTIARNFARARANHLLQYGITCNPHGQVTIDETENDLNEGDFSDKDCFKIGPSNHLLTYQTIHFLNMGGWKASVQSLSYLLACEYLRSVTKLKAAKKSLKGLSPSSKRSWTKEEIMIESEKKERLEKYALKFVRKSVQFLIEQEAIFYTGDGYIALGDEIETSGKKILMDPYVYNGLYSTVLQRITEIHHLTRHKEEMKQYVLPLSELTHRKPRIYLASTCYDLRDLRFEVARALREWGYQPYLNEDSDFPVKVGVDSYQTCIEAVKQSDCLVLVIGTRYGGEVEGLGISITELEYRTARENGIPRINFCLDSVWNIAQVRKKNPQMTYPDYFPGNKEKTDKVFRFLDDVRKYEMGKTDNWVHPFRNSVELKEILRKQLKSVCPTVS
jgi:hypothetical protein